MSQASFAKRQREKERRERAAAKAERRADRQAAAGQADPDEAAPLSPAAEASLLASLADLHARFEAGEIEFDDFVEAKEQITERLSVG
jgi:hypothetical protein